jgi:3-methyladenine DNA glycosylase/8-oxoguanine DNA glycosylase
MSHLVEKLRKAFNQMPDDTAAAFNDVLHTIEAKSDLDLHTISVEDLWEAMTELIVERQDRLKRWKKFL